MKIVSGVYVEKSNGKWIERLELNEYPYEDVTETSYSNLPSIIVSGASKDTNLIELKISSEINPKTLPKEKNNLLEILRDFFLIVEAIASLHKKNLSIGLLSLKRIVENESELRILGQSLITTFGSLPDLSSISLEEANFLSPELTGKTNTPPDHRSDLYAIGVLLYRWISETYPYEGDDVLSLVHQHLTIDPKIIDGIPPGINQVIQTLLKKNPVERYQSAEGLKLDLERFIKDPKLFTQDRLALHQYYEEGKLNFPSKLYGRDKQLNELIEYANTIKTKGSVFVEVAGNSGIGKSALVEHFGQNITGSQFITGKFDQYKKEPYSAVKTALAQLVGRYLVEEKEQWNSRLKDFPNMGIVTHLIPEFEMIVGKQKEVEKMSPIESQNRFKLTFNKLIQLLADKNHPLIIFIDDWQWADLPSIHLLKALLQENIRHLMIIVAYRDNEMDDNHPYARMIKEVRLSDYSHLKYTLQTLTESDVSQMTSDIFVNAKTKNNSHLSSILFTKTSGNAFFVKQFLKSLVDEGLVNYKPENNSWTISLDEIKRLQVSSNVATLVTRKLEEQSEDLRFFLKTAAHIGNVYGVDLLDKVVVLKNSEELLHRAEEEDFIQKISNRTKQYEFTHDKIQQACYAIETKKQIASEELHKKIAVELISMGTSPLEICPHISAGLPSIKKDYDLFMRTLISGGYQALEANSEDIAKELFESALKIYSKIKKKNSIVELEICKGLMQACFLINEVELAEDYAKKCLQLADTRLDKAKIYSLMMLFYESLAHFQKNIEVAFEALAMFDIDVKSAFGNEQMNVLIQEQYELFESITKGKTPNKFIDLPEMSDEEDLVLMELLVNMLAPAYFADLYLFAWCDLKLANHILQNGKASSTPFSFVFLGTLLVGLYQQFELGYQFGKVGIKMLDSIDSDQYRCRTLSIFPIFIQHIGEPIRNNLQNLKDSVDEGLQSGDLPYVGYSVYGQVRDGFLIDPSLNTTLETTERAIVFMEKVNNAGLLALMKLFRANLKLLTGDHNRSIKAEEKESLQFLIDIKFFTAVAHHYIFKSWSLCILKKYDQAWKLLEKNQEVLIYASSQSHVPKHYFLRSLILLRKGKTTKKAIEEVTQNQLVLKTWATAMPDNFKAEYELIEALISHTQSDWPNILKHFKNAVEWAQKGGMLGIESLIYELCGEVMDEGGLTDFKPAYLIKANQAYTSWGAKEKVNQLVDSLPKVSTPDQPGDLDTRTLLKATRAISAEVTKEGLVKRLLEITMENAGAEKCVIILKDEDQFIIEAEIQVGQKEITPPQQISIEDFHGAPKDLIQTVIRTKKEVLINDIEVYDSIGKDYLVRNNIKSLLILPIVNMNELIGVLYLENDHVTGVFQKNNVEILRTIASQAAITLVNAKLFDQVNTTNKELLESKAELTKLNETLEDRIKERTVDLQEQVEARKTIEKELQIAKDDAESANRAKSTFLANMSHEIRSPLNAIVGFSQILINQGQKLALSSSFLKYLDNIRVSSQNLSEIINDVLDLSKIESGKMSLSEEDINLKQVVQSVYHLNKGLANDKEVVLEYDFDTTTPQFIKSDRSKLRQILMNLVSNAIKFTRKGKKVVLTTGFENEKILLKVKDQGVGISPKKQKQIFDPFVQADANTTREYGGTGLGLAITKEMVTLLGGTIKLESKVNIGTTVTVSIPFKIAERIISDKVEVSLENVEIPSDAQILVVEDNPMNQEMIKALFSEMNHKITLAGSGEEGIKLSKKRKPDIVLMDIHMPGMDGFEAMQKIKIFDHSIPVIGLSADAFSDQQATALESGFDAYLTKPIQTDQLIACLHQFLGTRSDKADQKQLTKSDLKDLGAILSKLDDHEIYETEKLVEVIELTKDFLHNHLKEELLNLVYAGDKVGLDEKVKQILNG